jgi:hypothetical protein
VLLPRNVTSTVRDDGSRSSIIAFVWPVWLSSPSSTRCVSGSGGCCCCDSYATDRYCIIQPVAMVLLPKFDKVGLEIDWSHE